MCFRFRLANRGILILSGCICGLTSWFLTQKGGHCPATSIIILYSAVSSHVQKLILWKNSHVGNTKYPPDSRDCSSPFSVITWNSPFLYYFTCLSQIVTVFLNLACSNCFQIVTVWLISSEVATALDKKNILFASQTFFHFQDLVEQSSKILSLHLFLTLPIPPPICQHDQLPFRSSFSPKLLSL